MSEAGDFESRAYVRTSRVNVSDFYRTVTLLLVWNER